MEREATTPSLWGPGFTRFDTTAAPLREGFDYWCSLFPLLHMRPLRSDPYRSTALACAGDDGTVFSWMRADPTASHFRDARDERVMLSLIIRGGAQVRHGSRREDAMLPGLGLNLLDCANPARTTSRHGHESLHLSLPRSRVVALLGPSPAGDGASFRHLPNTPLAKILKTNLMALARHGMALDPASAARAVELVSGLAMSYLALLRPERGQHDPPAIDRHLFDAACRYMEAHLDDPALTAESVATALRCSRAHLYRLFARRGLPVAAHLRELRLLRSRALLRDAKLSISEVAVHSGYGDLPAYSKAFKRRFDMAPSEWRNDAMPVQPGPGFAAAST